MNGEIKCQKTSTKTLTWIEFLHGFLVQFRRNQPAELHLDRVKRHGILQQI